MSRSKYVYRLFVLTIITLLALGSSLNTANAQYSQPPRNNSWLQNGQTVGDIGFRPQTDGFRFENYGGDASVTNLTPAEMQRLFGDAICAQINGKECVLTPSGQEALKELNTSMNGGHCEGMAVLSLLLYLKKQEKPTDFGGDKTIALQLAENDKLQREIAYWFSTQYLSPTKEGEIKGKTPAEILDLLIAAMKDGAQSTETYTLGIYKREFKEGHAITPYAVVDNGNGIYQIMVYDNNYPNEERSIKVDRKANTWEYTASVNPDVPASAYEGDANSKTMTITATSPRLGKQDCPFCAQPTTAKAAGLAFAATKYNAIYLTTTSKQNQIDLLIKDAQGHRLGYENGKFFNEIPNADFQPGKSGDLWMDDPEPVYLVPVGVGFTVTVDGSQLKNPQEANVALLGPGYDIAAEGIKLNPGQKDTLTFAPDGSKLSYTTTQTEAPNIVVGIEHSGADYSFEVQGFDIEGGGTVNVGLDYGKGNLTVNLTGSKKPASVALIVDRIDPKIEATFSHDGIEIAPNETIYVEFGKWDGQGDLPIGIDMTSSGNIDQTVQESNQKK